MGKLERRAEAVWIPERRLWRIQIQKDGERRTFYSSTPGRRGKREAEAKADEWLETQTKDVRLFAAWDEFLAYQKEHNGKSNYDSLEYIGRRYVLPNVGNKVLSNITPVHWQKCVDAAEKAGLSQRTCKNVKSTISAFISYARRRRWSIERLERGDIQLPKNAPREEKQILQPDDLRTLFTEDTVEIYGRPQPAFFIHAWRFLVLTGLREGELCGLRNEDIEGDTLTIRRAINKYKEETRGKNANALRSFVLSSAAMDVLRAQRAMLKERGMISGWVFPDEHGERLETRHLYTKWLTYRKQHGMRVTIHELRHTFISLMQNEMPAQLLKAFVGHSESMDTFGVYGHEVAGEKRRAAKIIDNVFERIIKPQEQANENENS